MSSWTATEPWPAYDRIVLDGRDDQAEPERAHDTIAEFDEFVEVVTGVDVQYWER